MTGAAPTLLGVRDLSLDLGEGASLSGLSLEVAPGELVQLCGPADAGAAALRALAGLARPSGGEVRLLGEDPHALARRRAAELLSRVGWLPRDGALLANLTLQENLLLPYLFHRGGEGAGAADSAASAALRRFGLERAPRVRPERAALPVRRRVALARAVLLEPPLLLLDDPLDDLDAASAAAVAAALAAYAREPGHAVVVASPDPDVARALGARLVHLQVEVAAP